MRLPIEKSLNPSLTSSQFSGSSNDVTPLWVRQAGLEWFYVGVCKVLYTFGC